MSREQISQSDDGDPVEPDISESAVPAGEPRGLHLPSALREQLRRAYTPGVIAAISAVDTVKLPE